MSEVATARQAGRPAGATREEVLAAARAQYRRGERIDVTSLSASLTVGRATIYRWFGSREGLMAAVLVREFDAAWAWAQEESRLSGGEGVLASLRHLQELITSDVRLATLLQREGTTALRLLAADGPFQRHVVSAVQARIVQAQQTGSYEAPLPPEVLAYALVRVAEAFIYHDTAVGVATDLDRLVEVERALLAIP